MEEFFVLKALRGTYFKNDTLKWVPDLETATLFKSVEDLKKVCTFDLKPYRILRYRFGINKFGLCFLIEIIEGKEIQS
jgi:hypothetical protein